MTTPAIAALAALFALAGVAQALAPASAAAMDDDETSCTYVLPGIDIDLATGKSCDLEDGGGGAGTGGTVGHETIHVQGTAPADPPCADPDVCLPRGPNAGADQDSDSGTVSRGPRRLAAKNGAAKKNEKLACLDVFNRLKALRKKPVDWGGLRGKALKLGAEWDGQRCSDVIHKMLPFFPILGYL